MPVEYVGRPVKRLEDPQLLTGADPYVNDVRLDGALVLAVARSPYAHARLVRVDTGAARAVPGVVGAWSAAELQDGVGVIHSPVPDQAFDTIHRRGHTLLAEDRVRYVGQPVAVVVAESAQAAADGVEAVDAEYEPLPAVVDAEATLAPGAPLLYRDLGTNLALRLEREQGDVDAAFASAAVAIEVDLVNQRLIPLAMEPRACSAVWDGAAGRLTIWGDTQVPHRMRDQIAARLKLPADRVHLLTARVGRGFGAKVPVYPEDTLVPLLAMRLGRPVRWVASRREDIQATGHGRDMRCRLSLAADRDGRIRALDARIVGNVGFCLYHVGPILPVLAGRMITGCYDIATARVRVTAAFTNTMATVPYRGAGRPEAAFFIERGIDVLAARLGMDPADVRRRNFIPSDKFPYTTMMGNSYDSGDYARTLDTALTRADVAALRRRQAAARAEGRVVGIGIASYVEICGMEDDETSDVEVGADGRVTVLAGTASHGRGHEPAYAQLVADALQVPIELVTVVHGDTARVRSGVGTFGSRSISRGGMHALGNAIKVREQALRLAATLLEAAPEDIVQEDGRFHVRGLPDRHATWRDVAARGAGQLRSREDLKGQGTLFPFGSHVALVEIDRDTGRVDLLAYVSVDDSGLIVNPLLAQGQVHGGLAQGIGQALWEGAAYDDAGQLLT